MKVELCSLMKPALDSRVSRDEQLLLNSNNSDVHTCAKAAHGDSMWSACLSGCCCHPQVGCVQVMDVKCISSAGVRTSNLPMSRSRSECLFLSVQLYGFKSLIISAAVPKESLKIESETLTSEKWILRAFALTCDHGDRQQVLN